MRSRNNVAMFDPPTQHHELVRHYTLSEADLAPIRRCRGDHNRPVMR